MVMGTSSSGFSEGVELSTLVCDDLLLCKEFISEVEICGS